MRVQIREIAKELGIHLTTLTAIYKKKEAFSELRKEIYRTPLEIQFERVSDKRHKLVTKTQYFITIPEEKVEEFKKKILENYKTGKKESFFMGWTRTALQCYKNQMLCAGCDLEEFCQRAMNEKPLFRPMFERPPLIDVVEKLLEEKGKPPSYLLDEV